MKIGVKVKRVPGNIVSFLRANPGNFIALNITAFFMFLFSLFSLLQYYSLGDSAYDLGMHAQMLESFLHGGLFYSPLIGESLLAEHFTLFEFFQVPVYALFQSPVSLLVFQDIFIAAGGFILYIIAKHLLSEHINSKLSLEAVSISFLIVYEMSPYTQSLVSFPFHSMAFLPFFFLLALYSFLKEKRFLHLFSLVMIITLHSNFVYIVGIMLLYELIFLRTGRGKKIKVWLSSKHDPRGKVQFSYFIIFAIALYAYVVFAGLMKGYISGTGFTTLFPSTGASGSASDSPLGLLILLLTNPHSFFSFISTNGSEKVFYLSFIFENTGYLAFLSPFSLIMTIPYLLYALPSSYPSYYQLGYQYGSMLSGPVFFGSIVGLCNLSVIAKYASKKISYNPENNHKLSYNSGKPKFTRNFKGVSYPLLFVVVILIISVALIPYGIFSPEGSFKTPEGSEMQDINSYRIGNASTFLIHESNMIPSEAYILTENSLMPYFSNHMNTYSTPWSPGIYGNISRFTYVVLQYNSFWATTTQSVPSLQTIAMTGLANGTYIIIASLPSSGIFVLERS